MKKATESAKGSSRKKPIPQGQTASLKTRILASEESTLRCNQGRDLKVAVHRRLKWLREKLDIPINEMSTAVRQSNRHFTSKPANNIPLVGAFRVCQKWNVNAHWLLTGQGEPFLGKSSTPAWDAMWSEFTKLEVLILKLRSLAETQGQLGVNVADDSLDQSLSRMFNGMLILSIDQGNELTETFKRVFGKLVAMHGVLHGV